MQERRDPVDPVDPIDAPLGDAEGREGGKAAAGDRTGTRGQLDSASGGYGSQSGTGSSGGTGEGDGGSDSADGAEGAADAPPTEWLRRA
jgi:hypothetical protein